MKKQSTTPAQNPKCKGCGIEYNRDNVAREYGAESMVYLGGYHSAACYTDGISKEQPIDKSALIEICGSVVPISEVERVWMLHCATTPTPGTDAQPGQLIPAELGSILNASNGKHIAAVDNRVPDRDAIAAAICKAWNEYPKLEARNRELVEALKLAETSLITLSEADCFDRYDKKALAAVTAALESSK
jgi:hypothetical protein